MSTPTHQKPAAKDTYDRLIVGAGLFGLYAATVWARRGMKVAIVDTEVAPMLRASYINQARLHFGYHYPRSVTTARSSIHHYDRFMADFTEAINSTFEKIYAISSTQTFMSPKGFKRFCERAEIPCDEVDPSSWFLPHTVEAAYRTRECSFDANTIRKILLSRLQGHDIAWLLGRRINAVEADDDCYDLTLDDDSILRTAGVLNATYAGLNQILRLFDQPSFPLEYQLCEIILADVGGRLNGVGITVMDGDYFSLMPFGKTGAYSLTTVDYTPRMIGSDPEVPTFPCQAQNPRCGSTALDHCAYCRVRPDTAFPYALQRARSYLSEGDSIKYRESLFTVKTILRQSDVDDSRPTLVEVHNEKPWLCSVLSGKVGTIYDLDEVL